MQFSTKSIPYLIGLLFLYEKVSTVIIEKTQHNILKQIGIQNLKRNFLYKHYYYSRFIII